MEPPNDKITVSIASRSWDTACFRRRLISSRIASDSCSTSSPSALTEAAWVGDKRSVTDRMFSRKRASSAGERDAAGRAMRCVARISPANSSILGSIRFLTSREILAPGRLRNQMTTWSTVPGAASRVPTTPIGSNRAVMRSVGKIMAL